MPHQEVLDDPASAYPQLGQLLGGWFHQDWPLDGGGWERVVDDFIAESNRGSVSAAAAEIAELLGAGLSDEQLQATLEALGGNVDASAFNLTAEAWLRAVERRLAV